MPEKNRTLCAMVTYGGKLNFSKLAIQSMRDTSTEELDYFVIVGKPGDKKTIAWLEEEGIPYKVHEENMGFPYSVNDIYDYAWKENNYKYLILIGNDIVAYPNAVDQLIEVANTTENTVISALQYDVKSLVKDFPEVKHLFMGSNFIFSDFSKNPWEQFTDYDKELTIADMKLYDIQNMCLYTKEYFEVVGYTDVNFFPAYYIDNDVARRIVNSKLQCCSVPSARFGHWWSRTIKQGSGASDPIYFENNRKYYIQKWGGDFGQETLEAPVGVFTREYEEDVINFWKAKHDKEK